jgi:hypothetical protein
MTNGQAVGPLSYLTADRGSYLRIVGRRAPLCWDTVLVGLSGMCRSAHRLLGRGDQSRVPANGDLSLADG